MNIEKEKLIRAYEDDIRTRMCELNVLTEIIGEEENLLRREMRRFDEDKANYEQKKSDLAKEIEALKKLKINVDVNNCF